MTANLTVEILSRDFTRILPTNGVRFRGPRYSKHVKGGPKHLTIRLEGDILALETLLTYARCPFNVWDAMANKQWWGWIYEYVIYAGDVRYGFTMDEMANKVAIFYTQQTINQRYSSSGDAVETSFLSDATSVSEYGTIESRLRHGNMDADAATARRQQELDNRKEPQAIYGVNLGGNTEPYAVLKARGWFDSLSFQYYTNTDGNVAGYEENAVLTSEVGQRLGQGNSLQTQFIANSQITTVGGSDFAKLPLGVGSFFFVSGSALNNKTWTVTALEDGGGVTVIVTPTNVATEAISANNIIFVGTQLWQTFELASDNPFYSGAVDIRLRNDGGATDGVTVKLYSVSGGLPDTLLATATIAADEISESMDWVTSVFDTQVLISFGTTYGLLIDRAGGDYTDTGYYSVGVDEAVSYTRGSLQLYTDATNGWKTRPTNADLIFRISGLVETTTQISSMVTSDGEFISAVQIDDASGVRTPPYRDGLNDVREYVLDILKGGTSGNKRLLANVDSDRRLVIYQEPTAGSESDFLLAGDGEIRRRDDSVLPRYFCAYGQWAVIKRLLLSSGVTNTVFIDEVEYDGEQDEYSQVIPRNTRSDFDLFSI